MRANFSRGWYRIHLGIAVIIGVLGFAYFVNQALVFSETLPPGSPDEGVNLYQGFLYAIGHYQPFQDYGPWTAQMPAAYLIPGMAQSILGPGLETGRMYAIAVGALAVLGVWLAVLRNANAWWAAAAVWVIALNTTYVQTFSQVKTEALVSMLFAWMLFFGLGADRQDWELTLAGFFAGLAGMAYLNVLPVFPLFLAYVYWQFDKHAGRLVLLAGLMPIAAVHLAYWPDVLKVWANGFRPDLFTWAADYQFTPDRSMLPANFSWWPPKAWITDRGHLAWVGIEALGQAVRLNLVVFFGLLITLILWPWQQKDQPKGRSITKAFFNQHKQVVFLLVTFVLLFVIHVWMANGRSCQFTCLPEDIIYFFIFGLVLIPVASTGWQEDMPYWKQVVVVVVIFLLFFSLEYNFNSDYQGFRTGLIRNTFDLKPPKWEFGVLVPGTERVWQILERQFGYNHFPMRRFIVNNDQAITWIRWIKILGFLAIVTPLAYAISEKYTIGPENYGTFALTFTLLVFSLASGSGFIGGILARDPCRDSVIASYEEVGRNLDDVISDGSLVYWDTSSNLLLLYLPTVQVFPQQLNGSTTFSEDPDIDPEQLYRFGWWDNELNEQWLNEADYFVVENRNLDAKWDTRVADGEVQQVLLSEPTASCRGNLSRIVVLEPLP